MRGALVETPRNAVPDLIRDLIATLRMRIQVAGHLTRIGKTCADSRVSGAVLIGITALLGFNPSSARADATFDRFLDIFDRCFETATVPQYVARKFEGAEFSFVIDGLIHLRFRGEEVAFKLSTHERDSGRSTCYFGTGDVSKEQFTAISAELAETLKKIGIQRNRRPSKILAEYSGCAETIFGIRGMKISMTYYTAEQSMHSSIQSTVVAAHTCAETEN